MKEINAAILGIDVKLLALNFRLILQSEIVYFSRWIYDNVHYTVVTHRLWFDARLLLISRTGFRNVSQLSSVVRHDSSHVKAPTHRQPYDITPTGGACLQTLTIEGKLSMHLLKNGKSLLTRFLKKSLNDNAFWHTLKLILDYKGLIKEPLQQSTGNTVPAKNRVAWYTFKCCSQSGLIAE